jgi:hypothetical protein
MNGELFRGTKGEQLYFLLALCIEGKRERISGRAFEFVERKGGWQAGRRRRKRDMAVILAQLFCLSMGNEQVPARAFRLLHA